MGDNNYIVCINDYCKYWSNGKCRYYKTGHCVEIVHFKGMPICNSFEKDGVKNDKSIR